MKSIFNATESSSVWFIWVTSSLLICYLPIARIPSSAALQPRSSSYVASCHILFMFKKQKGRKKKKEITMWQIWNFWEKKIFSSFWTFCGYIQEYLGYSCTYTDIVYIFGYCGHLTDTLKKKINPSLRYPCWGFKI